MWKQKEDDLGEERELVGVSKTKESVNMNTYIYVWWCHNEPFVYMLTKKQPTVW